jgi:hypothetical protein
MTISVVLRVAPAALDAGRLAGEAELVATGERRVVRNAHELLAFLAGAAAADRGRPAPGNDKSETGGM